MNPVPAPIGDDDVQAFVDGRLPSDRRPAVEAWLRENPETAAHVAADRAHRDMLRAALAGKAAEPIPARLRLATIAAARRGRFVAGARKIAAAVVLLALGAAGGFFARGSVVTQGSGATARVTQNAVSAFRTYTVEVAHPVEVPASDETHLLRWLSRRLGRPLIVPDLKPFGYRLIGGRLLPADGATAALLMYDTEGGARLTVYVRAGEGGETAFRYRSEGDLSTFAWLDRGFGFAVSAALSREKLQPIVDAVYRDFDAK